MQGGGRGEGKEGEDEESNGTRRGGTRRVVQRRYREKMDGWMDGWMEEEDEEERGWGTEGGKDKEQAVVTRSFLRQ